jgi:hypothetical protein
LDFKPPEAENHQVGPVLSLSAGEGDPLFTSPGIRVECKRLDKEDHPYNLIQLVSIRKLYIVILSPSTHSTLRQAQGWHAQDKLREESPGKPGAKRFFVVPPLVGLLRMTREKEGFRIDTNYVQR